MFKKFEGEKIDIKFGDKIDYDFLVLIYSQKKQKEKIEIFKTSYQIPCLINYEVKSSSKYKKKIFK